jgi:hypothetical protein
LLLLVFCAAAGCRLLTRLMAVTAAKSVDLYNVTSGTWSTAELSVVRKDLAATSVGNVAIFAGGYVGNSSPSLCVEGLLFVGAVVCG